MTSSDKSSLSDRFEQNVRVNLNVNGTALTLQLEPRETLLDVLRERLCLYAAKKGCNRGECGACTVLVDGQSMNACMVLAVTISDRSVVTVEGLAQNGTLHPVQQAFIECDAFQCGFCTPGQICSAIACISEGQAGSPEDIREWMSGNLCRCAAYPQITEAVAAAARRIT